MKTAIFYSSSHGTTEKVALAIKNALGENTEVFNLKKLNRVDVSLYDQIVIGGSIHAGNIQKNVKDFCRTNLMQLLDKRVALFICGMNEPELKMELNNAYPELLRKHALVSVAVGGEFLFDKMNFVERLIIRKISGFKETVSSIKWDEVEYLISRIKN